MWGLLEFNPTRRCAFYRVITILPFRWASLVIEIICSDSSKSLENLRNQLFRSSRYGFKKNLMEKYYVSESKILTDLVTDLGLLPGPLKRFAAKTHSRVHTVSRSWRFLGVGTLADRFACFGVSGDPVIFCARAVCGYSRILWISPEKMHFADLESVEGPLLRKN